MRITAHASVVVLALAMVGCSNQESSDTDVSYASTAAAGNPNKPKNDYNIAINYELGMHCTGFDFSYCCVLPPYNSVQSQVIKTADGPYALPQLLGAAEDDEKVLVDDTFCRKLF